MDSSLLDAVMRLLDATTRTGLPLLITDIPASSPTPEGNVALFVEGGQYRNIDGAWTLSLYVSSATSTGASGVSWDAQPADWLWDQYDPGIRWVDLAGVML